jgi:hypothetical protein
MILGPDQIVACPFCAGLAKYMTLISGNTFGSQVWTDGKQIAPMLPAPPAVVKCRHRMEYYWLRDAKEVGTGKGWGDEEETVDPRWDDAEYVEEPTEDGYYAAIERNLARGREQERSLRILAWWRRNDAFRRGLSAPVGAIATASTKYQDNLKALADLLDTADENDLAMKAEVFRELGEFEAAMGVLNQIEPGEYSEVIRQIRDLCERQDSGVRQLRFDT